ncbi:MAG: hypothetical protein KGL39_10695 [Patescibacteria group bacterium]|nr:hypothetical protein [Patescibacteria group bacterium]
MTPDEILALPAGPMLDRLVAEKVMGWHAERNPFASNAEHEAGFFCWHDAQRVFIEHARDWKPSEGIACAWNVVNKMHADGRECIVANADGDQWEAEFYGDGFRCGINTSETAQLAICRAA